MKAAAMPTLLRMPALVQIRSYAQLATDAANDNWQAHAATPPKLLVLAAVIRLAAIPMIGTCLIGNRLAVAALLVGLLAALHAVESWVVSRFRPHAPRTGLLDRLSDRLLLAVVTLTAGAMALLPLWFVGVTVARDVATLVLRPRLTPTARHLARASVAMQAVLLGVVLLPADLQAPMPIIAPLIAAGTFAALLAALALVLRSLQRWPLPARSHPAAWARPCGSIEAGERAHPLPH